jgi:rhamnosyltransferase
MKRYCEKTNDPTESLMQTASLTILFYPEKNTLIKAMNTYAANCSHCIFIDNTPSPDLTLENTLKAKFGDKVVYKALHENKGIAFALNRGFEMAEALQMKYVLTMDQDSWYDTDEFFKQISSTIFPKNIAIVSASMYKTARSLTSYDSNWWNTSAVITSGNWVYLLAWKDVDGFQENWFIDEIDHDFCLRLREKNWSLLTSKKMLLNHQLGNKTSCQWLLTGKKINITLHNPERTYYIIRNSIFLIKRHGFKNALFALNRKKMILTKMILILLLYPNKLKYIKYYLLGILDGITHNTQRNLL